MKLSCTEYSTASLRNNAREDQPSEAATSQPTQNSRPQCKLWATAQARAVVRHEPTKQLQHALEEDELARQRLEWREKLALLPTPRSRPRVLRLRRPRHLLQPLRLRRVPLPLHILQPLRLTEQEHRQLDDRGGGLVTLP